MSTSGPMGPEWILETADLGSDGYTERLTQCARRLWPQLRSSGRRALTMETSAEEKDQLITEVFESVLISAKKVLQKGTKPIQDLDAYVAASFHHAFARRAKQETRLRKTFHYLPADELDLLRDYPQRGSSQPVEDRLQVEEIIRLMDSWTQEVWVAVAYGMSWEEISRSFGVDKDQARQRFRYAIKKIKMRLNGTRNQ
jgi:DNA-directed RNA polymerase specialized sigma24 family protein